MTKKELSQVYYIRREIERDKEKLTLYRAKATSTTGRLTPEAQGANAAVSDKVGSYAVMIADIESEMRQHIESLYAAEKRIMGYINGIEDAHIRLLFKLRFIDCLYWYQIAMALGGGNTEDSVKKMVYRYINNTNE